MSDDARAERLAAVNEAKRAHILGSALRVFARDGLQKASIRAIANEAGYAPGAIYGYFSTKDDIYAAALEESLTRLRAATEATATLPGEGGPAMRYQAASLAFYDFYDANPQDLDMGFYLFSGGMAPRGLTDSHINRRLNAALIAALAPIREAAEEVFGADASARVAADMFAHASGLLLLRHTRRLDLFELDARDLMKRYLHTQLATT